MLDESDVAVLAARGDAVRQAGAPPFVGASEYLVFEAVLAHEVALDALPPSAARTVEHLLCVDPMRRAALDALRDDERGLLSDALGAACWDAPPPVSLLERQQLAAAAAAAARGVDAPPGSSVHERVQAAAATSQVDGPRGSSDRERGVASPAPRAVELGELAVAPLDEERDVAAARCVRKHGSQQTAGVLACTSCDRLLFRRDDGATLLLAHAAQPLRLPARVAQPGGRLVLHLHAGAVVVIEASEDGEEALARVCEAVDAAGASLSSCGGCSIEQGRAAAG